MLDGLRADRPLTTEEERREIDLRSRKREARRRHDLLDRRLRRLSAELGYPVRR